MTHSPKVYPNINNSLENMICRVNSFALQAKNIWLVMHLVVYF